jgi:hypothetical protein
MTAETLELTFTETGLVAVTVGGWEGFRMDGLDASVALSHGQAVLSARKLIRHDAHDVEIVEEYSPGLELRRRFRMGPPNTALIESELTNRSGSPLELADIRLLRSTSGIGLGAHAASVRLFEQGSYWARVRGLGAETAHGGPQDERDASQKPTAYASQYVWLVYDRKARMAFLTGFETGERWTGEVRTEGYPGRMPSGWSAGFGAGLTRISPGQTWQLESLALMAGHDPWALLCAYGDRVSRRHGVRCPESSPVSWCSWYPYRLGVSDQRVRATAEVAAARLRALGLRTLLLDLGWQEGYLPSAFKENDQFPEGLHALSEHLGRMGFALGTWCAPFTISAHDPLAKEHPEWLLGTNDTDRNAWKPQPTGSWYWQPYGETFALDLTHPGAQEWLRRQVRSLSERGVRYVKPDFIGGVSAGHLTGRADRTIVAGGGAEAARIGLSILHEEIMGRHPGSLILNCGGPEIPGKGACPLLYTCDDTGNTGYVGWKHLRNDYGSNVAGHLWKNRRWGIIQPSCMVVGLPGGIEEARVRATATFLAGGQVDIGDDLTTLPEDRWQVLLATLPPVGISAVPVDLFGPIETATLGYDASASGRGGDAGRPEEDGIARIWVLPIAAPWDTWTLVGLFNYDTNDNVEYGKAEITRFRLPLRRLGLDPDTAYSVHEFWSAQYLGVSPFARRNPKGYRHPGDTQALISSSEQGIWEVAFFGPGVKLLVVRKRREHPWPAASTFHQSGGVELKDVRWSKLTLSGVLKRPAGQSGTLILAAEGWEVVEARVGGRRVPVQIGANGSVLVPVLTERDATPWSVRFRAGGQAVG